MIEGIVCGFLNAIYQIDENKVIIGRHNIINIINIDKCVVEKTIEDGSLKGILCFLKLRDNKTILCGKDDGAFCIYDMNTEQYTFTKRYHKNKISDLLMIDDNTFISCSYDTTIKVFKY